ncbi:MAG: DUF805 domain-containing protein [Helicobacteraceae bacterium]|jgi:uncharacterized membrane protein YhaH (DUF805 family)|nr:DUF805 domain-containing protein [Helicobacteraceae bacterium]
MNAVKGWFQVWLDSIKEVYSGLRGAKSLEGGVFDGRLAIRHYWTYFFVTFAISIVLTVIESIVFFGLLDLKITPLSSVFGLATLIPTISLGIRRLHDTGKIGWWILAPFYNLYLLAQKGDAGDNAYGAVPTDIERNCGCDKKEA